MEAFGAMAGAMGLNLIGQLFVTLVGVWLWLRLCMGPVMSFRERQFRLFESWALTQGQVLRMFVVFFLVFLMLLLLEIICGVILFAAAGATLFAGGAFNPQSLANLPPEGWIARLTPLLVVFGIVLTFAGGVAQALIWAPVAQMYRQLRPDDDVASTFI
jgi:hypothetical protein